MKRMPSVWTRGFGEEEVCVCVGEAGRWGLPAWLISCMINESVKVNASVFICHRPSPITHFMCEWVRRTRAQVEKCNETTKKLPDILSVRLQENPPLD